MNRHQLQSRTYDYSGEEECDKNAEISLKAILAAKETQGFAAVKVCVPNGNGSWNHIIESAFGSVHCR